ncbi:MAG: CheR family methyltransferase [Thermodesulfobacteriota bacterium]
MFSTNTIKMSEEEFRLLRDLVYNLSGIYFDSSSLFLLERRLSYRVKAHGMDTFKDYYRFLLYNPKKEEELSTVLDVLTTNETYFFREMYQLKAFKEEILPEIKERKAEKRRLRIWSAGCSTGEEPYTIAMLILESGGFEDWNVEIFGSDICQRVLSVARKGIYTESSFRTTEGRYKKRFFESCDGKHIVKDEVKRLVSFGHLNLLDADRISLLGKMDVIFCRNVIIYFDMEAKKRVIENLYNRLYEGGYLLQGHSESLINISTAFTLVHLKNDMVYRKPFSVKIPTKTPIDEREMASSHIQRYG